MNEQELDDRAAGGRGAPAAPAILAMLALALASGCARPAPAPAQAEPEGWLVPDSGQLVLVLGAESAIDSSGRALSPIGSPDEPGNQALSPAGFAPFAVARAVAAIKPLGDDAAVLAVNRAGLVLARVIGQENGASRLALSPLPGAEPEFAGRTVSQAWGPDEAAFFLLYRNPVFETEAARSPSSALITATAAGASLWNPSPDALSDAFAAFPVAADAWLVQSRAYDGERVNPSYARWKPASGSVEPLSRADFEKAAGPLTMSKAPAALRKAVGELAGPLILETRLADGSRLTYLRGDPSESAQGVAQVSDDGTALVVMADGRCALARPVTNAPATPTTATAIASPASTAAVPTVAASPASASPAGASVATTVTAYESVPLTLEPPMPEARFRDAAMVGGLVVAVWTEESFPDVGRSGLVAARLPPAGTPASGTSASSAAPGSGG